MNVFKFDYDGHPYVAVELPNLVFVHPLERLIYSGDDRVRYSLEVRQVLPERLPFPMVPAPRHLLRSLIPKLDLSDRLLYASWTSTLEPRNERQIRSEIVVLTALQPDVISGVLK